MKYQIITTVRDLLKLLVKITSLVLICCSTCSGAVELHTKAWAGVVHIGQLSENKQYKYYLDSRLELEDDKYKFEEAYVSVGIGYQTTRNLILFLGNTYKVAIKLNGATQQEYRLWQQSNWTVMKNSFYSVASVTRLEERWCFEATQVAVRLREKVVVRVPFRNWVKHSFVVSDEIYLNLNHPAWVNPKFFDQNRAFIGVGTAVSKYTSFDLGYMNQYIFGNKPQMSNILYLSFNVNCG